MKLAKNIFMTEILRFVKAVFTLARIQWTYLSIIRRTRLDIVRLQETEKNLVMKAEKRLLLKRLKLTLKSA